MLARFVRLHRDQRARREGVRAEREATASSTAKALRTLGLRSATAHVVRHGGEAKIAIYVSLEAARELDARPPQAVVRLVVKLARTCPEVAELVRTSGLLRRARAPARA